MREVTREHIAGADAAEHGYSVAVRALPFIVLLAACGDNTLPPLCPVESSPYDFTASRALIERAETNTRTWLDAGGLERPDLPHELTPHEHALV